MQVNIRGNRGRWRGTVLLSAALLACLAAACDDGLVDSLNGGRPDGKGGGTSEVESLGAKLAASTPMVRNLSNREYLSAISDLIGERLSPELQKGWTPTTQFSGFDAVAWTNLDAKAIRDRAETLETILDRAVAAPKVMTCSVTTADALRYDGCAKRIVEPLATRGFGRPLTSEEAGSLAARYDAAIALAKTALTDPAAIFKDGVRAAIGSIFLAPQFLTRTEAAPSSDFTGERDLDGYELASRLSFMLTGSLPDDELWDKAVSGDLTDPGTLTAEATRLLDAKVDTFVQTFMGQWLDFRAFDTAAPGSSEAAMYGESWRTLSAIVKDELPVTALVKPGFTFVNQELATHYGLPGTFTSEFAKVTTDERGGILQQGSWLTLSATALKTSPMHRGRLVQDRLLCKVIPPPDSALFEQIQQVSASIPATATVKQRVEQHRQAGPACFGCHQYMDPIGIGLEGFDQVGKVRTVYADTKLPVETDSEILGKPFRTVGELNDEIVALPEYGRCAAEKLSVFGLRRVVDATTVADGDLLTYLTHPVDGKPPSFREMVLRLVKSNAFRRVNHGARS
jgi:hypothetical protein